MSGYAFLCVCGVADVVWEKRTLRPSRSNKSVSSERCSSVSHGSMLTVYRSGSMVHTTLSSPLLPFNDSRDPEKKKPGH